MMMKQCCVCKQWKPYSDYYKAEGLRKKGCRNSKDGYRGACKVCTSERDKRRYYKNHTKETERVRNYRKNNPDKISLFTQVRAKRIKNGGVSCTLLEFKILCQLFDNRCLRCGQKTRLVADHIIPTSVGGLNSIMNIQPLCVSCNVKKKGKLEDFRSHWIRNPYLWMN